MGSGPVTQGITPGPGEDRAGRVGAWGGAADASQRVAEEGAQWLERPDPALVQAL